MIQLWTVARWSLIIGVNIALIEVGAYAACSVLRSKGVIFYSSKLEPEEYKEYLAERDPVLGWPSPDFSVSEGTDSSGARYNPVFPDPATPACLSLYGDSFTRGEEVSDAAAWSAVLSQKLNCRVANFGVGGYGTDQAYLRYVQNIDDHAPKVILGIYSENIIRNVNRYRDFLYPNQGYGFKPRFVLDSQDELALVDIPTIAPNELESFLTDPNSYLAQEFFALGKDPGVLRMTFPYTLSIVRGLLHSHMQLRVSGTPRYLPFYDEEHPSEALAITFKIAEHFVARARSRSQEPLVLIIAGCRDFEYFKKEGHWPHQLLLDKLEAAGIPYHHSADAFIAKLGSEDPCSMCLVCGGHYTEEGNEILAADVFALLSSQ